MADSIRIDAGEVTLLVNDDPSRVIKFNPEDILFVERFYSLLGGFEDVQKKFQDRLDAIPDNEESTAPRVIAVIEEACDYLMEQIDSVFGAGTSEAAFAGAKSLSQIEQFFLAIAPYVKAKRQDKVTKYQSKTKKS